MSHLHFPTEKLTRKWSAPAAGGCNTFKVPICSNRYSVNSIIHQQDFLSSIGQIPPRLSTRQGPPMNHLLPLVNLAFVIIPFPSLLPTCFPTSNENATFLLPRCRDEDTLASHRSVDCHRRIKLQRTCFRFLEETSSAAKQSAAQFVKCLRAWTEY